MNLTLDYQTDTSTEYQSPLPTAEQVEQWIAAALTAADNDMTAAEITVRIVDATEGKTLNEQFRGRQYPTNVLSFPFNSPVELPIPLLGDLVICAEVVEREAKEQQKAPIDHWTHMVIHGTLHLLGYDHVEAADADVMERLERSILADFAIADPYQDNTNTEHNA